MIIVTGMPRSGTSLVMRLLFYLDIHLAGRPFPRFRDDVHNPDGYFEDLELLSGDYTRLNQTKKFAVKTMLRPLVEKNIPLNPTDHKVILCTRPINNLLDAQMESYPPSSTRKRSRIQNIRWYNRFESYIGDVPTMTIHLPDLRNDKINILTQLKAFVGSDRGIAKAASIIWDPE